MKLTDLLLARLERETAPTRKLIERVPDGKNDWKPHPKSMEMGYLSTLVASMPGWVAMMIEKDYLDLGQGGGSTPSTTGERLAHFDKSVEDARRSLSSTTDDHLLQPWQLRVNGNVVDEKPRHIMITDTISHLAHHRGQLTV